MPIYVPPRGPSDARIMIVGEAPGYEEAKDRKPFVGFSGMELARMLHEVGILEAECFITNVLRFNPPGNDEEYYASPKKKFAKGRLLYNGWYIRPEVLDHFRDLDAEIAAVKPNVIIACGNLALWALTGESGITRWRGSVVPGLQGVKVIPTIHPAAVQRVWSYRATVVQDLRRVKKEAETAELFEPDYNFVLRPDYPTAYHYLDNLLAGLDKKPMRISCDIETRAGQIACIGFALNALSAICIPFMCIERKAGYWSESEELELTKLIRKVMLHPNIRLSGQNFIYDAQYIGKQWGFLPDLWWDTMNMQHVLFPDLPPTLKPKSLGFLAAMYCEHPRFWKDEGKLWDASMPEEQLWQYNCKDAVVTWEVAEAQVVLADKMRLDFPISAQMALWKPLTCMTLRGIAQDLDAKTTLAAQLKTYMDELQTWLEKILGHPFNPSGSSPQGKKFFYDDLGIRAVRKKSGPKWTRTLDDDALEIIAKREPLVGPIIRGIQNWRSAAVFHNTFATATLDTDNRMRCSWNMATAKTFRLSSSESAFYTGTNLQNQPSGEQSELVQLVQQRGPLLFEAIVNFFPDETEAKVFDTVQDALEKGYLEELDGKLSCRFTLPNVRRVFLPDPGMILVDADLDRADLQVVVWEAEDVELKQMLREGVDIHAENAKVIGLTRPEAKAFVHATNYGAGTTKLAVLFNKTVYEMEVAQTRWFSAHPGIKEWHERTAGNLPNVENPFGYRIHFFDRLNNLLPKALAWTPQGTVANVINQALIAIETHVPEAQLLLQVHDSLVFQIPEDRLDLLPRIKTLSEIPIPYSDPLTIPISMKISTSSWGEMTKWTG